jgi:hypothetical protein
MHHVGFIVRRLKLVLVNVLPFSPCGHLTAILIRTSRTLECLPPIIPSEDNVNESYETATLRLTEKTNSGSSIPSFFTITALPEILTVAHQIVKYGCEHLQKSLGLAADHST